MRRAAAAPRRPRQRPQLESCPSTGPRRIRRAMDFELQWLLLGLPVAFALGWLASRFDLRQVRREQQRVAEGLLQGPEPAAQRAARQGDRRLHRGGAARPGHHRPALRARQPVPPPRRIRARGARAPAPARSAPTCPGSDRDRAQHALAQDFMKAGLFDRAEAGLPGARRAPPSTPRRGWRCCAARALARLARRRRGRPAARDAAAPARSPRASRTTGASSRWRPTPRSRPTPPTPRCSGARGRAAGARGRWCSPASARAARGDHAEALRLWDALLAVAAGVVQPGGARLRRQRAAPPARPAPALERLRGALRADADASTCSTAIALAASPTRQRAARARCSSTCASSRRWSAAQVLLPLGAGEASRGARRAPRGAAPCARRSRRAARPLQRYRCAACGFEAQHYFWQCPGCLGWDTYPPQRLEDL